MDAKITTRASSKFHERNGDVLTLADATRWRVAPFNIQALDEWRQFDPVEVRGQLGGVILLANRRSRVVVATELLPGEE